MVILEYLYLEYCDEGEFMCMVNSNPRGYHVPQLFIVEKGNFLRDIVLLEYLEQTCGDGFLHK